MNKGKKFLLASFTLLSISASLMACGNKESEHQVNPNVSTSTNGNLEKVDVEIGEYKGLEAKISKMPEITDDDVEAQIQSMMGGAGTNKIIADQPIENGDRISINFETYDHELNQYGEPEIDYYFIVGSGVFLDGYDEDLIGKCGGDVVDIVRRYESDYPVKELAGKTITYKISINGIVSDDMEKPELTDAYVETISDCKSVDEFKEQVKEQMEKDYADQKNMMIIQALWDQILETVKIDNYPTDIFNSKVDAYKEYDTQSAELEGITLEAYVQNYLQMTMEEYNKQIETVISEEVKYEYVIKEIAKKEGFYKDSLSEEEWETFAKKYEYEQVEDFKKDFAEEDLILQIMSERVNEVLVDSAKVTEE